MPERVTQVSHLDRHNNAPQHVKFHTHYWLPNKMNASVRNSVGMAAYSDWYVHRTSKIVQAEANLAKLGTSRAHRKITTRPTATSSYSLYNHFAK